MESDSGKTAFWKTKNKFVSLFAIEKNENFSYKHGQILPAYA